MAAPNPLDNYDLEQFKRVARSAGIRSWWNMRRETIIKKLEEQFGDTLIDQLQNDIDDQLQDDQLQNEEPPNEEPEQQPNDEQEAPNNEQDDEKMDKEIIPIQMNINITAHVLADQLIPIPAPVMHKWARDKFRSHPMGTDIDDEGNEKVMTVTERLKEMDAPSDDEHIYMPHKLWICGSRFTSKSMFIRSSETARDRQWYSNQFDSRIKALTTTASQNGSNYILLGNDTTTRALMEHAKCGVQRSACSMKTVGDMVSVRDPELSDNYAEIWKQWIIISDKNNERAIEEIKQNEKDGNTVNKQTTFNNANQQKILMDQFEKEEISLEEFKLKMKELTSKLLHSSQ